MLSLALCKLLAVLSLHFLIYKSELVAYWDENTYQC